MPIRRRHTRSRPVDGARRIPGTLLLALALLHAGTTTAGMLTFKSGTRQVTLLELYTSQGCSSCPPAERWLNEYVDDAALWTRIVPLAFHVDYWDYIGWKDVYASAEHGERQRDYARAGKARSVYTPGLFANGREWRGWTLRVNPRASSKEPGSLSVTVAAGRVTATFETATAPNELHIALLGFDISTRVERGENRNSTLKQQFVVLAHESHVSGNGHWSVPLPQGKSTAPRYAIAAWVSTPGDPAPLQATGGWLPVLPDVQQRSPL
ncbi:MAG: DUF1223 domain-containing protein [Gammaproteobacteria bacterium]